MEKGIKFDLVGKGISDLEKTPDLSNNKIGK